jgi:hypothetical protein
MNIYILRNLNLFQKVITQIMQFQICKKNYLAILSGCMHACYFSVYTSIYLCCSFWYRFESSLLIKGSLVCFTLEIYNLSISFRNWTKIYNECINLKCFNNVKETDEHFVYFRINPFTEWIIFFEKYSHSMYRPELHLQSLDKLL